MITKNRLGFRKLQAAAWLAVMAVAGCTDDDTGIDPDPDPGSVTCGEGTVLRDGMCVGAGGLACGAGTHQEGNLCVTDDGASYEIRLFSPQISADGHSKTPVLVIGTTADGKPATDRVVLNTDRAGAGTFVDPAPTLGQFGATTSFVPCNATTPGCTGPVGFTLALASAPQMVIARLDVVLVEPAGVGSTAPCMGATKAMYFDGNDYIYNGTMTVTNASWSASGSRNSIAIHLTPSQQGQGYWWDLDFDSRQIGVDLAPGVYEMAQRAPFAQPGHPGLEVTGDGRGCNTISGRFQVHAFERVPNTTTISRALVTFEQHCEGGTPVLNGCVRYEQ
ncbi:MAG TPA: hypothetical protein VNO30_35125 [Kofleriaceae bacterium]|nr:hypothetical protein [Kofleriaceae bacterium]